MVASAGVAVGVDVAVPAEPVPVESVAVPVESVAVPIEPVAVPVEPVPVEPVPVEPVAVPVEPVPVEAVPVDAGVPTAVTTPTMVVAGAEVTESDWATSDAPLATVPAAVHP